MNLSAAQDDDKTLRWHLQIVYEQSGEMPADLDVPDLPHELSYLCGYFLKMNRKRTAGAMSANPLSDAEIMAWQQRHGITLSPFEGECIDALDAMYMASQAPKK